MNEQPPKIYLLPNLMTAGNLFCGFAAALKILQGALLQVSNPDVASDLFHLAIWLDWVAMTTRLGANSILLLTSFPSVLRLRCWFIESCSRSSRVQAG